MSGTSGTSGLKGKRKLLEEQKKTTQKPTKMTKPVVETEAKTDASSSLSSSSSPSTTASHSVITSTEQKTYWVIMTPGECLLSPITKHTKSGVYYSQDAKQPDNKQDMRISDWVDGYIQLVPYTSRADTKRFTLWCNEEGALKQLPINDTGALVMNIMGFHVDAFRPFGVCGNLVITNGTTEGGLSETDAKRIQSLYTMLHDDDGSEDEDEAIESVAHKAYSDLRKVVSKTKSTSKAKSKDKAKSHPKTRE